MKKSIITSTALALFMVVGFTSCNTPTQRVENAQEEVNDAEADLKKANEEYLADVESYRKETAEKIASNNQSILDFNNKIQAKKAEARADYKKEILSLEQKNADMQRRMNDYKSDGKDDWKKFKTEFNHDMDELGKAFKALTVNNIK
jgi:chromosome segregation ATPase